jgi:hypothetical protein
MPVNTSLAHEIWDRYLWLRDNGHHKYVQKAEQCENFFEGLQWSEEDLSLMRSYKRPALTINKIISTISNVLGEQIFNRADIAYKPRGKGATADVATALSKVFMQISDNNNLPWIRSDVFCDGIITSRGYFDVRLEFDENQQGEIKITQPNPKNVLIDSDADEYDPDTWGDVVTSKWMSPDEIEAVYSKKDADLLRSRVDSYMPYGLDAVEVAGRDRFGDARGTHYQFTGGAAEGSVRSIRVIERQYRKLDKALHFVDLRSGETRPVPADWDETEIQNYLENNPDAYTQKRLIRRIRWTVVADNIVLHDDWSPYRHYTIVPYFPYFRRGRTVGLVENLLGPQELLNKVSSQELHVINTTANSGWKIKRNGLVNMTIAELEQRGAQSGLVLELDDLTSAEKITPNQTPSGLDRISYKAEEHIKSISGVSDYMSGFAREDVSAKSVVANQQGGQANLAKVMDNMNRSDHMLARVVLSVVQEYYTEERLVHITTDKLAGKTEEVMVNEISPEGGIVNDLTLGEYSILVTRQPERDQMEDSQFEQAMRLRTEAGIPISDKFIIGASRMKDKADILAEIETEGQSEEAQAAAQLQQRDAAAEVAVKEANALSKQADARLRDAKSKKEMVGIQQDMQTLQNGGQVPGELQMKMAEMQMEMQLKREEMKHEFDLKREAMIMEYDFKREEAALNAKVEEQKAKDERVDAVFNGSNQGKE